MSQAEREGDPGPRFGWRGPASDTTFLAALSLLGGSYSVLIAAMLAANVHFLIKDGTLAAVFGPMTRYAAWLSLIPSIVTAVLAVRGAGSHRTASSSLVLWLGLISCIVTATLALVAAGSDRPDPASLPTRPLTLAIRVAVWLSLLTWSLSATLALFVATSAAPTDRPVAAKYEAALRFAVWLSFLVCGGGAVLALCVAGTDLADSVVGLISPQIQYAFWFSLISCSVTAVLSLVVAVPLGYLLSRFQFTGKRAVDALLDIPIVLPPLVIGLSLLILFQTAPGQAVEALSKKFLPGTVSFIILCVLIPLAGALDILLLDRRIAALFGVRLSRASQVTTALFCALFLAYLMPQSPLGRSVAIAAREKLSGITFEVPSVILAQFAVACAFAVRTMRVTFDDITPRREQVALTLGCGRAQAFWRVVLPEARRGMVTAATLAWARALGEFGPILVFAGATRMKTEVLSTTVFLELSVGSLRAAVAVSLLMVLAALVVLLVVRVYGMGKSSV